MSKQGRSRSESSNSTCQLAEKGHDRSDSMHRRHLSTGTSPPSL
jgi:hypothetical protein